MEKGGASRPANSGVDFSSSGCKRRGVAEKDVGRCERLAGQRVVAGVDESYFDADDEFWAPIRQADERDATAHEREVRQGQGSPVRGAQAKRRSGGAASPGQRRASRLSLRRLRTRLNRPHWRYFEGIVDPARRRKWLGALTQTSSGAIAEASQAQGRRARGSRGVVLVGATWRRWISEPPSGAVDCEAARSGVDSVRSGTIGI